MTIVTAKVAGVQTVVGCTSPILGKIPNVTVAAMYYAGADEIWVLGGVQAVAAMVCGTETMPKVYFIAGPSNAFVAEAKRQLFGEVGIDIFAGPTEVLVVADEHADPFTVATDLLSRAEHGPDTPAVLITTSEKVGTESIKMVTSCSKSHRQPLWLARHGRLLARLSLCLNLRRRSSLPMSTLASTSRLLYGIQERHWRRCRIPAPYSSVERLASRTVTS